VLGSGTGQEKTRFYIARGGDVRGNRRLSSRQRDLEADNIQEAKGNILKKAQIAILDEETLYSSVCAKEVLGKRQLKSFEEKPTARQIVNREGDEKV